MTSRRDFLKNISIITGGAILGPRAFASTTNPNAAKNPLRIAYIGAGNRAAQNFDSFEHTKQQICVALCDTDSGGWGLESAAKKAPGAALFTDYRAMLEKMHKDIDAVVISTPDFSHYAAAMCALNYSKPIYLEKPMCHTIWQIRDLNKAVAQKKVAAQMGNQSHSTEGIRFCAEWIKGGVIGTVREVNLWTDRPLGGGVAGFPNNISQYPPAAHLPSTIHWDLWQNITEPQEYFGNGITREKWRGWWKYGSGALGDIGCHMLDIPVYALGLPYPSRIKSRTRGVTALSVASQEAVEYTFAKSNQGVPVKVTWYSGFKYPDANGNYPEGYDKSLLPPLPKEYTEGGKGYKNISDNGQFIIGDKGVIYCPNMHQGGRPILLPRELWDDVKHSLPRTEERVKNGNHWLNFIEAVRGEAKLSSGFDYAHILTEVVQLGNLASRTGADIIWDPKNLVCRGNKSATALVNPPMRKGWF